MKSGQAKKRKGGASQAQGSAKAKQKFYKPFPTEPQA